LEVTALSKQISVLFCLWFHRTVGTVALLLM